MAILSECDYLPCIPSIGLKTACTLLRGGNLPNKYNGREKIRSAWLLETIQPAESVSTTQGTISQRSLVNRMMTTMKLALEGRLSFFIYVDVADEINSVAWILYWRSR